MKPGNRLSFLLGRSATAGTILAEDGSEAGSISGTDEYELMDGAHWIIHRVDVMMGDEPAAALELIGPVAGDDEILGRAFDASGAYDETVYQELADGTWRIDGGPVRATLRPESPEFMTARWERKDDDEWRDWMHMTFTRC